MLVLGRALGSRSPRWGSARATTCTASPTSSNSFKHPPPPMVAPEFYKLELPMVLPTPWLPLFCMSYPSTQILLLTTTFCMCFLFADLTSDPKVTLAIASWSS
ncbi:unnamed protein product [Prorocentrum cordatum]|uniref:Uncharacterized protein n=1 Tax=Prorocentrum cordatum TaxID=2364126 RepID=A0ABN9WM83_9DINO|nr:unnamed protein product [Polarella glacialis]